MKFTDKINRFLHPWMLNRLRGTYRKKLAINRTKHPDVFRRPPVECIAEHIRLWGPLINPVDPSWLDMFYGVSGTCDPRFVPEDIFYGVIERCFNNCNAADTQVEDKNNCCFYVQKEYQPMAIVRYVRGVWFDGEMRPIDRRSAESLLRDYPEAVVGKPSMHSCGGSNVRRLGHGELSIDWIERNNEAYVVQECLQQEPLVSSFNPDSMNTCRLVTFRRPWSGETSVIAGMLRLGCGKAIVDNLAAGGVSADIASDGTIAPFAVDHDFGKVMEHPVSHKQFSGFAIPYYGKMCEVCVQVAERVPDFNLLSFDVIARPNGVPCIIEINASSMTLAQVQTVRPLFGDETEKVVDWCAAHKDFDRFDHFRTWY